MRFSSTESLADLLDLASYEELSPIFQHLGVIQSADYPSAFLARRITEKGGNSVANIFRDGEGVGYLDLLNQVSSGLGLENIERSQPSLLKLDDRGDAIGGATINSRIPAAVARLEAAILQNVADRIQGNMTLAQRAAFSQDLSEKLDDFGASGVRKVVGAGGLIVLGNIGGFGTYTAMSSLLHFVSAGALGFGAYATASTVLSVVLGPVGWASLAGYAIFKSSAPKLKAIFPVVLSVCLIRVRHTSSE